jgi:hypothetical protein
VRRSAVAGESFAREAFYMGISGNLGVVAAKPEHLVRAEQNVIVVGFPAPFLDLYCFRHDIIIN